MNARDISLEEKAAEIEDAKERLADLEASLDDAPLCTHGPWLIRPKRGHRCEVCKRYIVGPPRPGDTAQTLKVIPKRHKTRRSHKGLVGHSNRRAAYQAHAKYVETQKEARR